MITAISEQQHSFRVGFYQGEIVLLTYRIKKGMEALQLLSQMKKTKISEHANPGVREAVGEVPDTNTVLSHLAAPTLSHIVDVDDIAPVGQKSII